MVELTSPLQHIEDELELSSDEDDELQDYVPGDHKTKEDERKRKWETSGGLSTTALQHLWHCWASDDGTE
ncbi:hypothetical protein ATANTOWER_008392 [Ataeniobius toweri]|uniref:Uncharacterized protein n=1 Tax=Ataeniobius toweri TaxID=208326 RepID=A0ABU7C5C6_9TELE|nr:hypothetical protein [Ataeniobius toweri]